MAPTPPPAEEPVKAAGVPATPEVAETAAPKAPETPKSPAAKSAKPAKKKPVRSVRTARPEKKPEPEPKKKKAAPQPVEVELDPHEAERAYMPIRSRRDGRIGCMGGIMYAAFILCASVLLAVFGWMAASDVLALNKSAESVEITLPESAFTQKTVDVTDDDGNVTGTKTVRVADMNTVSGILKDYGLINYKWLFQLYSRFSNAEVQLSPGTYALTTNLDYRALVKKMQTGADSQLQTLVMFPEGYNLDQVFARLEENGVCSREDLYAAAANAEFSYTFLEGVETGDPYRLEGFLFPKTYAVSSTDTADSLIRAMLSQYQTEVATLDYAYPTSKNFNAYQTLILASIIEKEASDDADIRAKVSAVFYNRLLNTGAPTYGLLGSDATTAYEIGGDPDNYDWTTDSAYNTRRHAGLPPTPICSPSIGSLQAACNPAPDFDDYYFFSFWPNDQGTIDYFFDKTYDEHQATVAAHS